jgi:hypothetical protein
LVGVGGTAWRIWIMFLIISLPSLVIPSYSCRAESGAFVVIMCQAIQQFSFSSSLQCFQLQGALDWSWRWFRALRQISCSVVVIILAWILMESGFISSSDKLPGNLVSQLILVVAKVDHDWVASRSWALGFDLPGNLGDFVLGLGFWPQEERLLRPSSLQQWVLPFLKAAGEERVWSWAQQ